jgi:class 3 adenylate cyclase
MSEARVERRLAPILAVDVAGYSRLMGADEVGTLAALKAHRRAIVDPAIDTHKGRIVKTTGDGILVEFASAVDAVTCAMAVQSKMTFGTRLQPDARDEHHRNHATDRCDRGLRHACLPASGTDAL